MTLLKLWQKKSNREIGDNRKKDGKQYTGAVGWVIFPMVNGREGGEGDADGEYVAAVERLLQLSVPDKLATWIFDTRRDQL